MKQLNKYLKLQLLSAFVLCFAFTASANSTSSAEYFYTNDALYDQLFSPAAENGLVAPIFGEDMISGNYLNTTKDGSLFFEEEEEEIINYGPGGPGIGELPTGDITIPFAFFLIFAYGLFLYQKEKKAKAETK